MCPASWFTNNKHEAGADAGYCSLTERDFTTYPHGYVTRSTKREGLGKPQTRCESFGVLA